MKQSTQVVAIAIAIAAALLVAGWWDQARTFT